MEGAPNAISKTLGNLGKKGINTYIPFFGLLNIYQKSKRTIIQRQREQSTCRWVCPLITLALGKLWVQVKPCVDYCEKDCNGSLQSLSEHGSF